MALNQQIQGFSNEGHLEEVFIKNIGTLSAALTGSNRPCLVLARQLRLLAHDILDVLACDTEGRLYVIEAKLCRNSEIRGPVFDQLSRYLDVLAELDLDQLSYYIVNYFRKHGVLQCNHIVPDGGWQTLRDIFTAWHNSDPDNVPSAQTLLAALGQCLCNKEVIPVILTDGLPDKWDPPELLSGSSTPLQVLAVSLSGELINHLGFVVTDIKKKGHQKAFSGIELSSFVEWERKRTLPAEKPEDFKNKLFLSSYQLVEKILNPWIKQNGFTVIGGRNAKSLSVFYRDTELIAFGPTDDDSKKQREDHGFEILRVLKANPIFRRLSPLEEGVGGFSQKKRLILDNTWRQLQLDCGYRRRGDTSNILPGDQGFVPFQTADYPKAPRWHGEFKRQYRAKDGSIKQDFYGPEDADALAKMLGIMANYAHEFFK